MTQMGLQLFQSLTGMVLGPSDDTLLAYAVLKRYTGDWRAICVYDKTTPGGKLVAQAFIDMYRGIGNTATNAPANWKMKKQRGSAFHFMQGMYLFPPHTNIKHIVKNALSLLTTSKRKIRSLQQHFHSYGHDNTALRHSTIMGKLKEIESICSNASNVIGAVILLAVELVSLGYPARTLSKALYLKFLQSHCLHWRLLASFVSTHKSDLNFQP
jgi:hypothetical protein